MKQLSTDVVVIGAGIAGLVAARDLVRHGHEALVLEARERVGGRLLNGELPGGGPIEMGGQWVGPTQDRVLSLIDELGLRTFPTHVGGRHIAELGGRRLEYKGRIPPLGPLTLADIGLGQLLLDRAARRIHSETPWSGPRAETLDGVTFAAWIDRHFHTRTGRSFMRLVTEAVFAVEPEDMSALWALLYVGAGGGLDRLIDTEGGAQQDRIEGGSQRIALVIGAELGDRVMLGAPVLRIRWSRDQVIVGAADLQVHARRAIVATPPAATLRIEFDPPLPNDRLRLLERMPMGRVIKVNAVYDRPFWREAGLSGQANSDRRPLGTVFDNSPPEGSPGVLVGFLEGRHAGEASGLDLSARRQRVLDDLSGYVGSEAQKAIAYLECDWTRERYTLGCYGAFAIPNTLARFGPGLRRPTGPLHWAGTETAVRWTGYMDGAVESGIRTAAEIRSTKDGGAESEAGGSHRTASQPGVRLP